jgi:hypothetical protein
MEMSPAEDACYAAWLSDELNPNMVPIGSGSGKEKKARRKQP